VQIGLSKSRLMDWRQCPRKVWLKTHRPELIEHRADTEVRFKIGFEIGEQARALYPQGILIDTPDLAAALDQTRLVLRDYPNTPVFEATFERDGVLVRVDLLVPDSVGAYRLAEVKASTSVKPHYIEDTAIQSWVVQAHCRLAGVALAHVNNQFVYPGGGDYQELFTFAALDEAIAPVLEDIPAWITQARNVLAGNEPAIETGAQCNTPYDCPFQSHCGVEHTVSEYSIDQLPRLKGWRRQGLDQQGIVDIRDIPEDYPLTETQQRIANVIRSGQVEQQPEAARIVQSLAYPRYYLDFETTRCAVPIWAGTRPYQQLPVQWSCTIEAMPGVTPSLHFLLDDEAEPLRAFAESLIHAVQQPCAVLLQDTYYAQQAASYWQHIGDFYQAGEVQNGPILVYNASFERRILRELANALPDLAPALNGISERIVDLYPIVRKHYYHPDMQASWSLKSVLPTMAPHLKYDELDIGDGNEASAAWQEILHPATSPERRRELRNALIDYCGLDTWAMVVMVGFFVHTRDI